MTEYLDPNSKQGARERKFVRDLFDAPPEGWYASDANPLEDFREAVRKIEKDAGYERPPWPSEDLLRIWGDNIEEETGRRPKTCVWDGAVLLPVPPRQRSQPSRSDSGRR